MTHFSAPFLVSAMALSLNVSAQQVTDPKLDTIPVVAPGALLRQVSNQFAFTEGPTVDKKGDIYFTDQPNDKIWKYDTKGELTLFMEKTGRSNGMFFDKKGNLISCADAENQLWSISPDKQVTVLLTDVEGKKLNGPNDVWVRPKGGYYFTDPYYQRSWWERKKPGIEKQNVYFLPRGTKKAVIVDADIKKPNGIIGTPDGKTLFVADIGDNKTYKYDIAPDGMLNNRKLFVPQGSDGMTLDSEGNLYLTGKGVTIYDKTGTKIGHIPVPEPWTANICFGGKDRRLLFITASKSIYTLDMKVKGLR